MKVLMLGWEFPPMITGGLGTASYGLTKALAPLVEKLYFVLPQSDHCTFQREGSSLQLIGLNNEHKVNVYQELTVGRRVTFYQLEVKLQPYKVLYSPFTNSIDYQIKQRSLYSSLQRGEINAQYGENLFENVKQYAKLIQSLAKSLDFDIIHAHDWMTFPAAVIVKKASGKPLIAHVHATEFDRSGVQVNQVIYEIEQSGFLGADKLIAVSHRTKNLLIKHYSVSGAKIQVVYNGMSKKRLKKSHLIPKKIQAPLVLFLGRLTMQKGPDYFIEAAKQIHDQQKDIHFVIAGEGDMYSWLIERVAQLRLNGFVHFTGFLRTVERDSIFQQSSVFVMPSVSEPFGLTCLEAMLYDTPVIISKQSGIQEILSHVCKVDFWDVSLLASSILDLLSNQNKAQKLLTLSRDDLFAINWNRSARSVLKQYQLLVSA